jgi:hypothetical protein
LFLSVCPECHQSGAVGDSHSLGYHSVSYNRHRNAGPHLLDEDDGDDQWLSDFSVTPRCFVSSSMSPTSSWGMADWSGFSHVYTMVQSVGPSLVIALHIKDVSILSEEPFQHSGLAWLVPSCPATFRQHFGPVVGQHLVVSPA